MKHRIINGIEKRTREREGEKEEAKNAWHLYNINILEKQLSATVFQVAGFASATPSSTDFLFVVAVLSFDVPLFIIVG